MRKGRAVFRRNDENEKIDKTDKDEPFENKGFAEKRERRRLECYAF